MANLSKHAGMRPQDVVVLLDIVSCSQVSWKQQDIASHLKISPSEVSESLNRSAIAGLFQKESRQVNTQALFEFLVYGLRYVFPALPGQNVRGVPTAYSAPVFNGAVLSSEKLVWPLAEGTHRGQAVEPLYPTVAAAALNYPELYDLLALVDALRIGRVREQEIARNLLAQRLNVRLPPVLW